MQFSRLSWSQLRTAVKRLASSFPRLQWTPAASGKMTSFRLHCLRIQPYPARSVSLIHQPTRENNSLPSSAVQQRCQSGPWPATRDAESRAPVVAGRDDALGIGAISLGWLTEHQDIYGYLFSAVFCCCCCYCCCGTSMPCASFNYYGSTYSACFPQLLLTCPNDSQVSSIPSATLDADKK